MSLKNPFADGIVDLLAKKADSHGCLTGLTWRKGSLLLRVTPPGDAAYETVRDRTIEVLRGGIQEARVQASARSHRHLPGPALEPFSVTYQEMVVSGTRELFLKITPTGKRAAAA